MSNNGGYYDPPAGHQEAADEGGQKTDQVNRELQSAIGTMRTNMYKTSERGERLDNLQTKTDGLADNSNTFRRGANKVRKNMWWKDMKMRIWIIVGIIVLLVIIIVPSVVTANSK